MYTASLATKLVGILSLLSLVVTTEAGQTLPGGGGSQPFSTLQPTTAVNYLIRVSGSTADLGEVGMFASDIAPAGWVRPEGQLLSVDDNSDLFSLLGTTFGGDGDKNFALPDMRGRLPVGAGSLYSLGEEIGSETTSLSQSQMPRHKHTFGNGFETDLSGDSQTHSNMQPSLALTPIIATQGIFPSRSSTIVVPSENETGLEAVSAGSSDPFIGEVTWIAHDNVPNGWQHADGQLLQISQNAALFSILGTQYGGDGRTTFALPDLRGRTPVGTGTGSGLDFYNVGTRRGSELEGLNPDQLPSHSHPMTNGLQPTDPFGNGNPQSHVQPTLGLTHLVATQGIFPSEPATIETETEVPIEAIGSGDPYLSSISMFAGNFAIRGFEKAEGQSLPISQFSALYALIWDAYGSDNMTQFNLPDLRSRATTHHGAGSSLTARSLGDEFGVEESSLSEANLPWHIHTFTITLPGDFNDDGIVNAADYTVWRDFLGVPANLLPNDVDGGTVGQAQYDTWSQHFGLTLQEYVDSIPLPTLVSVPEPSTWMLILMGLASSYSLRRPIR